MPLELKQYLVSALGALLLEVAYWYELRHQLSEDKYNNTLRSFSYWIISALMILLSPMAALIWFDAEEKVALKTYFLMGAAFPHFFKNAISLFLEKKTHLGANHISQTDALRNYFLKR